MNQLVCRVGVDSILGDVVFGDIFSGSVARGIGCRQVTVEMFYCVNDTSVSRHGQKFIGVNVLHDCKLSGQLNWAYLVKNHLEISSEEVFARVGEKFGIELNVCGREVPSLVWIDSVCGRLFLAPVA